jgi:flagellar basal-body rod modification protein FlgD
MENAFKKIAEGFNSNQALQASQLVGKKVNVRAEAAPYMPGEKISGSIDLTQAASDLTLEVINQAGQLIKTYELNGNQKGDISFAWDGLDQEGNALPAGIYYFNAKATINNQLTQLETYIASNVDSVTVNKNGQPITLNVSGYGKVSLNDIKTIS